MMVVPSFRTSGAPAPRVPPRLSTPARSRRPALHRRTPTPVVKPPRQPSPDDKDSDETNESVQDGGGDSRGHADRHGRGDRPREPRRCRPPGRPGGRTEHRLRPGGHQPRPGPSHPGERPRRRLRLVEGRRRQRGQLLGERQQRVPAVGPGRPRLIAERQPGRAEAADLRLGHPHADAERAGQHQRLVVHRPGRRRRRTPSTRRAAARSRSTSAPTSTRYVRITITANSGWPAGQLSELEVYGSGGTTPDTTAAERPGHLVVHPVGHARSRLNWGASTDNGGSGLAGYDVYRNGACSRPSARAHLPTPSRPRPPCRTTSGPATRPATCPATATPSPGPARNPPACTNVAQGKTHDGERLHLHASPPDNANDGQRHHLLGGRGELPAEPDRRARRQPRHLGVTSSSTRTRPGAPVPRTSRSSAATRPSTGVHQPGVGGELPVRPGHQRGDASRSARPPPTCSCGSPNTGAPSGQVAELEVVRHPGAQPGPGRQLGDLVAGRRPSEATPSPSRPRCATSGPRPPRATTVNFSLGGARRRQRRGRRARRRRLDHRLVQRRHPADGQLRRLARWSTRRTRSSSRTTPTTPSPRRRSWWSPRRPARTCRCSASPRTRRTRRSARRSPSPWRSTTAAPPRPARPRSPG